MSERTKIPPFACTCSAQCFPTPMPVRRGETQARVSCVLCMWPSKALRDKSGMRRDPQRQEHPSVTGCPLSLLLWVLGRIVDSSESMLSGEIV